MLFNALDNVRKLIHQVIGAEAVNMYLVEGIHAGPCARQTNQSQMLKTETLVQVETGTRGDKKKNQTAKGTWSSELASMVSSNLKLIFHLFLSY